MLSSGTPRYHGGTCLPLGEGKERPGQARFLRYLPAPCCSYCLCCRSCGHCCCSCCPYGSCCSCCCCWSCCSCCSCGLRWSSACAGLVHAQGEQNALPPGYAQWHVLGDSRPRCCHPGIPWGMCKGHAGPGSQLQGHGGQGQHRGAQRQRGAHTLQVRVSGLG